MSNPNPTRVSAGTPDGGRFAPNGQAEATVTLDTTNTTDMSATAAALDTEIGIYQASKARIELLSAKSAAQTILREYPDATHLQLGFSDQTFGEMTPEAILDADGDVITDDYEAFDDLQDVVSNLYEHGDWTAYRDYATAQDRRAGENPRLDLQKAAAISLAQIGSTTGTKTVNAGPEHP